MATNNQPESIQVSQDLEFQRKEWIAERISWVTLGVLILLGLLGVFGGSGLLTTTTAGDQTQGFWIEHERFVRNLAPTTLKIFIAPDQIQGEQLRIRFPQDYIGHYKIQSIEPQPEQVAVTQDGQEYTFNVQGPTEPVAIFLYLEAQKFGVYRGEVVLNDDQRLSIRQFSYP